MAVAVIDTNVLLDFRDEASIRHEQAQEIVSAMDHGELPTGRVTNYVVLETLNWLHERHRHDFAVDTFNRLSSSSGFEIVQSAQKDFHRAVELFEQYEGLSFGDATIAAYMHREEIEYLYSFDGDFDAVDEITRLTTASNPSR
ncbi:twitching motility protein PilT [Haladaptatus sp. W1]|uniref:type II toxin-antitoxin system VapC family toxin n=1 Tax=Haladaptatus sp. W1 TaxID=1897478 RepID=UPI000849AF03|nr:PIN domain-containing protein [Haladaptatus sp. W1]ODR79719.1 twitching motility protein PilT [Haladaptatus sp. W1]